jgi:hypothetical protein
VKRKHFVLAALAGMALLATGCNPAMLGPAAQPYGMSPNFSMNRLWRIAVLPPVTDASWATGLSDAAGMLLMKPGKFILVDRSEVDRVLKEQQFGSSGLADPSTAARLGKLMGAEAVLTVNVTQVKHDEFFKDSPDQRDAQLWVKIISVETAEVLYYAQGQGTSFEGESEAVEGALTVALGPLIAKGSQQ